MSDTGPLTGTSDVQKCTMPALLGMAYMHQACAQLAAAAFKQVSGCMHTPAGEICRVLLLAG